jgi:hypothetical protein
LQTGNHWFDPSTARNNDTEKAVAGTPRSASFLLQQAEMIPLIESVRTMGALHSRLMM